MTAASLSSEPRSIFIPASDGLRLHVREYRSAAGVPVVCLPGLTRTTADFDALATALADGERPRRVIAIDSRGRGLSARDPNPKNYTPAVESADVMTVLAALQFRQAVFVGSSRGGILTMLLAAVHPEMIAGVVLHDIGPVIEPAGVARIKSYVGKLRQPRNLEDGTEILRERFANQFPKLTAQQWRGLAERTWKPETGKLVLTYDPALAETLADFTVKHPLPLMWNDFDAVARAPVLVIRGANSDILSQATVNAMRSRHPDFQCIEVADQGHVPLLEGDELLGSIAGFVGKCERGAASDIPSP